MQARAGLVVRPPTAGPWIYPSVLNRPPRMQLLHQSTNPLLPIIRHFHPPHLGPSTKCRRLAVAESAGIGGEWGLVLVAE